ncbi:MAG TPA: hypothetical protein VFD70_31565 [Anaerolineae bacterium]|nr:hypothetical protein [Anaerolineae bacterium]
MSQPRSSVDLDAERDSNLDRIIGLSDGIFAFSMTLLAINVELPGLAENIDPTKVTEEVYRSRPRPVYVVSQRLD